MSINPNWLDPFLADLVCTLFHRDSHDSHDKYDSNRSMNIWYIPFS